MDPLISTVICTHNPDAARLRRTLEGLRAQSLPSQQWETLLIDNGSTPAIEVGPLRVNAPANLRVVPEPEVGLTQARKAGLREATAELLVFVDDDNVIAPGFLAEALRLMAAHPAVGLAGGRVLPEFAVPPESWQKEFLPLLALRDRGNTASITTTLRPPGASRNHYPADAPIGAGLVARRSALQPWLQEGHHMITGRQGASLASGEDNDIVLCALRAGWHVAYFPELSLQHLIPAARLEAGYLARLNRSIQKSWVQVLALHDASPWPPLGTTAAAVRKARAWFTYRAWDSPASYIRWQGACGHFEGRADLPHR
ncbi:MAG TPA: glycosyltransferase [Lacunisphaera sp.]|jgi:glycosyltransferase involved in cell wall biosynthesis|nr:glycosyltransferase [Lacunisphaera sp.]